MHHSHKKSNLTISCRYYNDNAGKEYEVVSIENGNGFISNSPTDWTKDQRIAMLKQIAGALQLNLDISIMRSDNSFSGGC